MIEVFSDRLDACRSIALRRGVLELDMEARVWTVTGERTAVVTGGLMTEGPQTGGIAGRLAIGADWQISADAAVTARIGRSFSQGGNDTIGNFGVRSRF